MRQPLHILGTGMLAQEAFALAESAGFAVEAFVENLDTGRPGSALCERPIIWVDNLPAGAPCVCALSTTTRKRFTDQVAARVRFVTIVHPSSTVLSNTTLGVGTIISTGVLIGSNTRIGEHVFINRGAMVGHHARIGSWVTIQPGANVAGAGEIGDQTYIGMGALVLERLTIGEGVTIAAGSLVRHDVPDHALVAGAPARIKKRDRALR
jgi:sugar O-acyltransferase (sialic acid O-acetyltransferase NeuD family)